MAFDWNVVYKDHEVDIPSSAVDQKFIDNLISTDQATGGGDACTESPKPPCRLAEPGSSLRGTAWQQSDLWRATPPTLRGQPHQPGRTLRQCELLMRKP